MESNKLTSRNPFMNPNRMTQKLVTYSDYNKLWDDVKAVEDNSGSQPFPITANANTTTPLLVAAKNGCSTNLEDDGAGNGVAITTAAAMVSAVNYTGSDTLTYNIREIGGAFITAADADPSIPYVSFTFADAGMVKLLELWVYAGALSTLAVTYVEVQNNKSFPS